MERNERKVREGVVVSDKMDKTVVVVEETMKLHKLYKKLSLIHISEPTRLRQLSRMPSSA